MPSPEMMAEFLAKGGKVTKLPEAQPIYGIQALKSEASATLAELNAEIKQNNAPFRNQRRGR